MDSEERRKRQQKEVDKNYIFFKEHYDSIIEEHTGKNFLLLKNATIIGSFESWEDAKEAARIAFEAGEHFSIQEIASQPAHLGYQSYAII